MAAGAGKTNEALRPEETHSIDSWKTDLSWFEVTILSSILILKGWCHKDSLGLKAIENAALLSLSSH